VTAPVAPAEIFRKPRLAKRLSSQVQVKCCGQPLIAVSTEAHTAEKGAAAGARPSSGILSESQEGRDAPTPLHSELPSWPSQPDGRGVEASEGKTRGLPRQVQCGVPQERRTSWSNPAGPEPSKVAAAKNARFVMEAEQERVRRLRADSDPDQLPQQSGSIRRVARDLDPRKQLTLRTPRWATCTQRYGSAPPLHDDPGPSQWEELRGALPPAG